MRAHGATWRIRLNLCILQPTGVHNPNGKSIGSAVLAQLTAESAYTLQWAPICARIAPSYGGSGPHLTHDALGPCKPTTQTASRSLHPCLHRWPQNVPILYNGSPVSFFPFKIAPSRGGVWTPCNTWLFRPTHVLNRNGNSIISVVLQGWLLWQTARPTDQRYSVGNNNVIGRTYVRSNSASLWDSAKPHPRFLLIQTISPLLRRYLNV